LDQTVWNTDFEAGTDKLTEAGKARLEAIARLQPCPDKTIYLATAHDLEYDPNRPDRYCSAKSELDGLRKAAVLKYMTAMNCDFTVALHDPPEDVFVLAPPRIVHGARLDSDEKLFERIRQEERLIREKEPEQQKEEVAKKNDAEEKPREKDEPASPSPTEEKYTHKNDFRTPLVPPILPGSPPPLCEDAPDEARILRAWPRVRGLPYIYEEKRDNVQITTELLVDKIDPPKFFPIVGMAQVHHCHWKVTIYYDETLESSYPFPFRCVRPRVQVLYMDLDHLHQYVGASPDARGSVLRDLTGF
jgi:hypothetical protein